MSADSYANGNKDAGADLIAAITEALAGLLEQHCPPAAVRAIEAQPCARAGDSVAALWHAIADSGFADALVDEARGGAGLGLTALAAVAEQAGRHALPLPLAETLLARAALARAGLAAPDGAIALGCAAAQADGGWRCAGVSQALGAVAVLAQCTGGGDGDGDGIGDRGDSGDVRLLPLDQAEGGAWQGQGAWPLLSTLHWPAAVVQAAPRWLAPPGRPTDLRVWQALAAAATLSGALAISFEMSLAHANQRRQFGRAIGQFQAIQHQLAQMAEQVFATRMAVQLACQPGGSDHADDHGSGQGDVLVPHMLRVAAAKARASEAALTVAALAHGIHGAIGFTREADLQLHTRRLHAGRQCAGSEAFWQRRLGAAVMADPAPWLDLLRGLTDAAASDTRLDTRPDTRPETPP